MPQRKTVTVLFADVVGSTSLAEEHDPETLRNVLDRYFAEARATVERHGGSVEKFIGDAVVALFGVPAAREDDALRALRAADELRSGLVVLNESFARVGIRIDVRMGVNTGEVVVDEARTDGFRASGDTMNVGARLEQSAGPGEILVGALTRELGGDAVVVEPVEPLEVKGKARPLDAFRLVRVLADVERDVREGDAPLVGRRRELDLLRTALEDARTGERCVTCTVVGPPGVGKSRLVRAFLGAVAEPVQVLVGRCPSYGEGVTFLPLAEALEPVLRGRAAAALLDSAPAEDVAIEQVEIALGLRGGSVSPEEAFSAIRSVLEGLAREQPLVLVVDDVHWAEPRLLDFLEYLTAFSTSGAILLLCLSRPELVDERPSWSAPRPNVHFVSVGPLADAESVELVGHLLRARGLEAADLTRVVEAADGNPLFLEQLLALNADADPDAPVVVPPTINALLAARLDGLEDDERRILEAASIEGRVFHREHVESLLSDGTNGEVAAHLLTLARRQFVRPARGRRHGVEAFAFAHGLVRDAAYGSMPKARRASMHVALAELLGAQEDALDEIVGLHLADAARLRLELGHVDEETSELALRAARYLLAGGERALGVGDDRAASKLLERAAELVGPDEHDGRVVRVQLARALAGAGRLRQADGLFEEAMSATRAAGERALELRALLARSNLQAQTDVTVANAELVRRAEGTLAELEELGDASGLALAWWLLHWGQFRAGRYALSIDAAERAVEFARRAGDRREELRALGAIAIATRLGPTPVEDGLVTCDDVLERSGGALLVEAFADRVRGCLVAMRGDFDAGRAYLERSREVLEELGLSVSAVGVSAERERVERLDGNLEEAERQLRTASERLREIGDLGYLSWIDPMLARVLALRGASAEAVELARSSRTAMQPDHSHGQVVSRLAEGLGLLALGDLEAARAMADEAQAQLGDTDSSDIRSEVLLLQAELAARGGEDERAEGLVRDALALYEQKGDVVSAALARARL